MLAVSKTIRNMPPSNETLTNVLGAQDKVTQALLDKPDFSIEDMGPALDSSMNIMYSLNQDDKGTSTDGTTGKTESISTEVKKNAAK